MARLRCERGALAVEFAVVVSVLLLVLFGLVQIAMGYHRAQGLEAAVREGARLASIGAGYDDVALRVRRAQSLFAPGDVQVVTEPPAAGLLGPCAAAGVGGFVTVTATVPATSRYGVTIPFWGSRDVAYRATGTFRCERAA